MSFYPPPAGPPPPGAPQPTPGEPGEPEGYQPFRDYYQPQPAPPQRRGRQRQGIVGGLIALLAALWAYGKFLLLFIGKFGVLKTLITLFISFGAYAIIYGPWFAASLVVMILLHEMGHVVEIRRQGMKASAPIFIPFLGAAIFQRQHPTTALKQAEIGIAGPISGTLAATAAFVLYGSTSWPVFLLAAWIGFNINLFNMIPFGMLDGGWILAAASKWFHVIGLALIAVAVFFVHTIFGPVLLILLIVGIPTMIERFRNDASPYYQSVPVPARFAMGFAWLALVAFLGVASMQSWGLLQGLVR